MILCPTCVHPYIDHKARSIYVVMGRSDDGWLTAYFCELCDCIETMLTVPTPSAP